MPREAICVDRSFGGAKSPRALPLREMLAAVLLGLIAAAPLLAMDWLSEREQQVEQMTPAEKEELNENYEKFLALPPEEQEQLRELHQKLDTDPNGERLRGVMHRYYDWLKTLPAGQRADLLSLPIADRVAKIKTLKQHQEASAVKLSDGSHLTTADVQVLSDWVRKYAAAHESELAKQMPPRHGEMHGDFPRGEKPGHERMGQFAAWRPWLGGKLPKVSKEEIDDLARHISAEPRRAIEALPNVSEQAELIHQWLQAIARTRFVGGGGFGRQGRNVSSKALAKFFTHDLSKQEQDAISGISDKEEQHRELRRLYFQHLRATDSSAGAAGAADQHGKKPEPAEKQSPMPPPDAAKTPPVPKT